MPVVLATCLGITLVASVGALGQQKASPEVAALIRQLGSASASRREEAARRLLEIGPRCVPALTEARRHRDPEIAARARELLETLDRLMLAGATVTLTAEPARVRWDQPFDLLVTVQNETPVACHLPFSPKLAALFGLSSAARQTGMLLDVADFLKVAGPGGRSIDPHVYDVADDPVVNRVVELRAEGLSYDRLAAGATKTYRVPALNRGRARYRMLAAGTYRIQLVYHPEWDDPQLTKRRVAYVESNVVEVRVLNDAPEDVRAPGPYLRVTVEQRGRTLIARLINSYDLPVHVNLSLNGASRLFARAHWVVQGGDRSVEVAVPGDGAFDPEKLRELEPAGAVELARCDVRGLLKDPGVRAMPPASRLTIKLRYVSLLSRANLPLLAPSPPPRERRAATKLPGYLITGHFESEPIVVPTR